MNKIKTIFDRNEINDMENIHGYKSGITDTRIIIKDLNGNIHFDGRNKVILPGSAYTATKHFNVAPPVTLPNYNDALDLENTVNSSPESPEYIYLFAVATDGCGVESSQIYDVSYKKWANISALVPFKYTTVGGDAAVDRTKYFGRKVISGSEKKYAYYFKGFETTPVLHMQYKDGTPIDSNIYLSSNELDVETYVELKLRITTEDCRDYFKATTGIATAKINSIMLLKAWPKVYSGNTYYENIQPVTKLNISNESLIDETKGLDIIYHLYY